MSLRFHWMLPKGGEVAVRGAQTPQQAARYRAESTTDGSPAPRPDMEGWIHFAERAEEAGIDSVLVSFSRYEPDPMTVSCALGQATKKLKYIIAWRSGLMQPTSFVQQINTLSALIGGRVSVNIVAGSSAPEQRGYGDFLLHGERYARAEEFLSVCNAFWRGGEVDYEGRYYRVEKGKIHTPFLAPDRSAPEIYVSGHSEESVQLAMTQGSSWLRVIDTPETLEPMVARVRARGIEVCLRACVICRPTREEAVHVAQTLLPRDVVRQGSPNAPKDDSVMHAEAMEMSEHWLSPTIFTGFVARQSPVWTTLLGTPREIADTLLAYKRIGVTELILSGWPEVDEVTRFGRDVVPLVREGERQQQDELREAS